MLNLGIFAAVVAASHAELMLVVVELCVTLAQISDD